MVRVRGEGREMLVGTGRVRMVRMEAGKGRMIGEAEEAEMGEAVVVDVVDVVDVVVVVV